MLWLYGRPDVYLLIVPGLGAASDIVATAARRPLANLDAARTAIAGVGFFGFAAWAAGTKVSDAIVLPTYSPLTAAVVLPLGLLVLVWLDTLRRAGRPRGDISLLFVVGFILALAGGAAGGGDRRGQAGRRRPGRPARSTWWSFAASLLLAVGALHHWAPKLWGRSLGAAAGALHWPCCSVARDLRAGRLPRRLPAPHGRRESHRRARGPKSWARAAPCSCSAPCGRGRRVAAHTAYGERRRDADGLTLEWATTSPPPPHNFDTMPEVRSAAPLADVRAAEASVS